MKSMTRAGLLVAIAMLPVAVHTQAPPCTPIGKIQFICDVRGPEDFAWCRARLGVGLGNQAGLDEIRALHPRDKRVVPLFPMASVKSEHDAKAFLVCPGPVDIADPAEKKTISLHGLYLHTGSGSTHRLFAVHHGARESMEAFDVDTRTSPPSLTWVGCVSRRPTRSSIRWSRFPRRCGRHQHPRASRRPEAAERSGGRRCGNGMPATGWAPVPELEGVDQRPRDLEGRQGALRVGVG